MSLTVNTNSGAYLALRHLGAVQQELALSQKRISTGYSVADAFDNGAVFGVAQLVRGNYSSNVAASQELGNFSGSLQTANAAGTQISNSLSEIRAVLTHLSSQTLSAAQFRQYSEQYFSLVKSIIQTAAGATYNGQNLLSSSQTINVLADGDGATIKVNGSDFAFIASEPPVGLLDAPASPTAPVTDNAINNFLSLFNSLTAAGGNKIIGDIKSGYVINGWKITGAEADFVWLNDSQSLPGTRDFYTTFIYQALAGIGGAVVKLEASNFDGYNDNVANNVAIDIQLTGSGRQFTITNNDASGGGAAIGPITFTATPGADVANDSVANSLLSFGVTLRSLAANNGDLASVTNDNLVESANAVLGFVNGGGFSSIQDSASDRLNNIGALNRQVSIQLSFNQSLRNAISTGLGALVDADLAYESARLTAIQVKQDLAAQALAIANKSPNILTGLFIQTPEKSSDSKSLIQY